MPAGLSGRVLVTGAAGFVGRHALASLAAAGYDVHGVWSKPSEELLSLATWHTADLLVPGVGERLVMHVQPTHLVHLAWTTTPGVYWTSEANLRWVRASLELLDAFGRAGGRRFVGAGSCAEYDWSEEELDEREAAERPATLYGRAKLALSHLAMASGEAHGFSVAWGRLFFLYGPYEHPARLVPTVARALLEEKPAEVGDGIAERDFMSAEDAGRAFAAILDAQVPGVVNVASGVAIPVREVVSRVAKLIGREDLVRWGARPTPLGEPRRLSTAASRLHHEVGFTPKLDLDAGLSRAVAFWRTRR